MATTITSFTIFKLTAETECSGRDLCHLRDLVSCLLSCGVLSVLIQRACLHACCYFNFKVTLNSFDFDFNLTTKTGRFEQIILQFCNM